MEKIAGENAFICKWIQRAFIHSKLKFWRAPRLINVGTINYQYRNMRSDLESDNSDDDEREDEKSTYDRAAYQKYLRNMPAEFLKQIKDSATKDNLPPGLVNVSESSSTEVSSMRTTVTTLTFATESEEMEYLYSNENKIEIRSPFVYKSIANFIFPTVKFGADSDMKFTEPNFGKTVPANKKEQARRICEKIVVHLGRTLNMGSGYSIGVLVPFWKAYRTEIKDELVRYRANVGSQAKEMYLEGKSIVLNNIYLLVQSLTLI